MPIRPNETAIVTKDSPVNTMTPTQAGTVGTPSAALARFAETLRYEDIPDAVLERARIHILDGLGLAVASTVFPFAGPTLSAVE